MPLAQTIDNIVHFWVSDASAAGACASAASPCQYMPPARATLERDMEGCFVAEGAVPFRAQCRISLVPLPSIAAGSGAGLSRYHSTP
jgi:hypothetical protein